jgi:hypothetical protein
MNPGFLCAATFDSFIGSHLVYRSILRSSSVVATATEDGLMIIAGHCRYPLPRENGFMYFFQGGE